MLKIELKIRELKIREIKMTNQNFQPKHTLIKKRYNCSMKTLIAIRFRGGNVVLNLVPKQ